MASRVVPSKVRGRVPRGDALVGGEHTGGEDAMVVDAKALAHTPGDPVQPGP
ncbi:MAG: hypothetical protein ABIO48_01835 [Pedococcus sp.]